MKKLLAVLITLCALLSWSLSHAEKLTIAIAGTNDSLNMLRSNVDSFHQVSEHRVDIVALPASEYDGFTEFSQWLRAELSEIDVYVLDFYQALALQEHLLELNYPSAKSHWPVVMQAHQAGGKTYALPYSLDVQVLFYRSDWVPFPPVTWEQMIDIGANVLRRERAFSNSDLEVYAFAADTPASLVANAMEWSASHGGGAFAINNEGVIKAHNIENIRAFNNVKSWIGSTVPDYNLELAFASMRDRMVNGGLVFIRDWYSQHNNYLQNSTPASNRMDWSALPGGNFGSAASIRGLSLAVSKYSENPALAAQFISHLTKSDTQSRNLSSHAALPTWSALYSDPALALSVPRLTELARVLKSNTINPPAAQFGADYQSAIDTIAQATASILNNQASAQGALSDLESNLNRLLTSSTKED